MKKPLAIVVGVTMLGIAGVVVSQTGTFSFGSIRGQLAPTQQEGQSVTQEGDVLRNCYEELGPNSPEAERCNESYKLSIDACKEENKKCMEENGDDKLYCDPSYNLCVAKAAIDDQTCNEARVAKWKACIQNGGGTNESPCLSESNRAYDQCTKTNLLNLLTIARDWAACSERCHYYAGQSCREQCAEEAATRRQRASDDLLSCSQAVERKYDECEGQSSSNPPEPPVGDPEPPVPPMGDPQPPRVDNPPPPVVTTPRTREELNVEYAICEEEEAKGKLSCAGIYEKDVTRCIEDKKTCLEKCSFLNPGCETLCLVDYQTCKTRAETVKIRCENSVTQAYNECMRKVTTSAGNTSPAAPGMMQP